MKKMLLFAVVLLFTTSFAMAKGPSVDIKKFKSWGEAVFDAETATVTFTKKWQGGGWWLSRLDCSEYNSIILEFEDALSIDVVFMVIYSTKDEKNEKLKSKITIPAGQKKGILELDITYKNSVDGLGISATNAGVIKLKSLNFDKTE